jgi:hypothetical protein
MGWLLLAAVTGVGADEDKNGHWEAAAKSSMIAEVILPGISMYYMGLTANFAPMEGYYSTHSTAIPSVKLMYAGALMSLIFVFATGAYLVAMIVVKHDWDTRGWSVGGLVMISTTTWLAS